MKTLSENRCHGGVQGVYSHASQATGCDMTFGLFLPEQAEDGPVPLLWFLSGLTCTHENAMIKAGAQRWAAEAGIATGSLYRHFSRKGELASEVFARASQREVDALAAVFGAPGSPCERLLAGVRGFAERAWHSRQLAFALIAERVGTSENDVLVRVGNWIEAGAIKRFGVVVRHHELGYTANAMLVHDVPDERVGELGRSLAEEPAVTLCYRRPRLAPQWPYNLFCMIHGRERAEVEDIIADLRQRHGLNDCAHDILFSLTRFKQKGARYA